MSSSTAVCSDGAQATKRLVEALLALAIEPGQPAAHRRLPRRLIADDEVHELGHAGVGGAARSLVARDDEIDQHAHRRRTRAR